MRLCNRIVIASTNRDKFEEFSALFSSHPEIELIPAGQVIRNAEKIGRVEKHDTYLENALAKARLVSLACHTPALADDSGLEVEALDGRPGVRSSRFAPPGRGHIEYLLSQLPPQGTSPIAARFVCTLALIIEGITLDATGILDGQLIRTPRGDQGFGYDPIFIPKDSNKTLAELGAHEKNDISHRARATQLLLEKLKQLGVVLAKP